MGKLRDFREYLFACVVRAQSAENILWGANADKRLNETFLRNQNRALGDWRLATYILRCMCYHASFLLLGHTCAS